MIMTDTIWTGSISIVPAPVTEALLVPISIALGTGTDNSISHLNQEIMVMPTRQINISFWYMSHFHFIEASMIYQCCNTLFESADL